MNAKQTRQCRIAVVTTSRADYSHLHWLLRALAEHPDVDLRLIVLGAHLSPEFGSTVQEIERDGIPIHARIECLLSSDSDVGMAKTIGVAALGLADALSSLRPDLLLLIADRYEMLAPASVALALRIPIAHIEGGEISEGAIDNAVRNALTMMAHVHFTSTEEGRRRVIAMGEESWRVHRAGAPSIDHLRHSALLTRAELESKLHIALPEKTSAARPEKERIVVLAYHPVTLAQDTTREAEALFAALEQTQGRLFFCYPNADAGGRALIRRTEDFLARRGSGHLFVNLDAVTYWSLLREADLFVGNSSSGIMETASFALPTVNVGIRQQGRERPANVLDADAQPTTILAAIRKAASVEFRQSIAGMRNPYGEGHASEKIVSVLTTLPSAEILLLKRAQPISKSMLEFVSA